LERSRKGKNKLAEEGRGIKNAKSRQEFDENKLGSNWARSPRARDEKGADKKENPKGKGTKEEKLYDSRAIVSRKSGSPRRMSQSAKLRKKGEV